MLGVDGHRGLTASRDDASGEFVYQPAQPAEHAHALHEVEDGEQGGGLISMMLATSKAPRPPVGRSSSRASGAWPRVSANRRAAASAWERAVASGLDEGLDRDDRRLGLGGGVSGHGSLKVRGLLAPRRGRE